MLQSFKDDMDRREVEQRQKWREIEDQCPYLKFDPEWEVKVIPHFGGAMARFVIRKGEKTGVSVYLDFLDALGCMDQPYWELYPYGEDGPVRCLLNETEQLMACIREELERQANQPEENEI